MKHLDAGTQHFNGIMKHCDVTIHNIDVTRQHYEFIIQCSDKIYLKLQILPIPPMFHNNHAVFSLGFCFVSSFGMD